MRVGLASDTDWRHAIAHLRREGAELICLPHLSFTPYVAAVRDRAGLELAERAPSKLLREALAVADGAWLAASAYESEGEGVFYITGYLAGPDRTRATYRQRRVEAVPERYEQMFWSPGHTPNEVAELPIGRTTTLVGADLRDPGGWAEAAAAGAEVVLGGASESAELWSRTSRVVAGMAAAHGMTALAVNRFDNALGVVYPGGAVAFGPDGAELPVDSGGLCEIAAR
jgi:predicted amidohydrolase